MAFLEVFVTASSCRFPNLKLCLQVCWEKLTNYFEIEAKYVNLTEDCYVATPEKLAAAVDENTIGVALILGTTYTGAFEDVKAVDGLLGNPLLLTNHSRSP